MTFAEQQRVAVVSTAHIRREDDERLRAMAHDHRLHDDTRFIVAEYHGGYLVRVFDNPAQEAEEAAKPGLSEEAQALIRLAAEEGFHWLRLDRDGPEIGGLPTFDW